ncbi:MAG: porin [Planctomycetota bacterium]|nr:porin [Planctomycetota bacterium]
MTRFLLALTAMGLIVAFATPSFAAEQPSARDIQAAVDSYLANSEQDANLVGGPGSAGYDQGFWIKGGDFSLKINLTLQARYEAWVWDDDEKPLAADFGGGSGTSGFSLPRATLKLSGTAPCSISYYMELEFGHFGEDAIDQRGAQSGQNLGPLSQSLNFDNTREAWIQWSASDAFNIRMGQIRTATTRQAMVSPEMQQFVDVSLATAFVGQLMPGYTDRNRDHGVAFHGVFGCNNEWSYLLTVTNGDGGDSIRNVIDQRTSDNLAFSGRLNWAFLSPIGYTEGALRNSTCQWYGELGAWGYYYADRDDLPHTQITDSIRYGVDLAMAYGGFSMTAAYSLSSDENAGNANLDTAAFLVQLGYHFPGTAWEIAARYSAYDADRDAGFTLAPGIGGGAVSEFAFGVNYYLNGHGNKMQLDAAWVSGSDAASALIFDPYAGYPGSAGETGTGDNTYGMLLRFQWQLAL